MLRVSIVHSSSVPYRDYTILAFSISPPFSYWWALRFQFVAILSKAAMTFLYKSLFGHIFIFLEKIPRTGSAESQGI